MSLKRKEAAREQYEDIEEHFIYQANPTIFMKSNKILFSAIKERQYDRAEIALLSNSSWNLKYCIDIAQYYLNMSEEENVKELTNKKPDQFESADRYLDFIRALKHRFLLPSIIFYNASFDYLYIFIYFLFTARKEILESKKTNKEEVLKEAKRLGLSDERYSWIFALNSLITKEKAIINQTENKLKRLSHNGFNEIVDEVRSENKKLRIKYFANIIKHQQVPFFKPKSIDNVGGAKIFIDINKFYSINEISPSIICRIPEVVLDVDKTQIFLINYHNITVRAFNYLLSNITHAD